MSINFRRSDDGRNPKRLFVVWSESSPVTIVVRRRHLRLAQAAKNPSSVKNGTNLKIESARPA
jgi:hypothetical protein